MSFLEQLDKRRKFDTIVTVTAIVGGFVMVIIVVIYAFIFAQNEREKIYVLAGDTPFVAEHTDMEITLDVEVKAHVNRFHELFFNLAPDETYIQHNIEKAMYLIDESGLVQYNTLKERGFYNNIISASAQFNIMSDSIKFDETTMKFTYYGRQRIERRSSILYRQLVSEGNIQRTTRTEKNPHGLTIVNYRTVLNKDLEQRTKSIF